MLKKLFGSGARVKLLQQFLNHPDEAFFIRELTRILDEQINSLRRELENLEGIGLLKSKEKNRKKYYSINPHFPLLHELTSIIRKTDEDNEALLKKVTQAGNIDICILAGHFVGQEASADLFVVGDVDKKALEDLLDKEFKDKNLKYASMTREDFLYRITLKDKFVRELFSNKDNIVLKNKLKKDTEPLV